VWRVFVPRGEDLLLHLHASLNRRIPMKLTRIVLLSALIAVPAFAGPDKDAKNGKLSDADIATLAHVHAVNQQEIDMGKLAKKNGGKGVRDYGDMLVKDHQRADNDVIALAKKHGISKVPDDQPKAPEDIEAKKKDADMMAKLKGEKGDAFDKDFLMAMDEGHTREIGKVDAAMKTAGDPTVTALLGGVEPVMQKHLDDAKMLEKMAPGEKTSMAPSKK
jgi:putative membrane protein